MHPDKKVGMALGILLVGIVGAFFFRNDTEGTESEDRQLASAAELDERIRTGTQVPYLPEREDSTTPHAGDVPEINIAELIAEIPDIDTPDATGPDIITIPEPIRIGEPGPAHDLVGPIPSPSPASDIQGVEAAVDGLPAPTPESGIRPKSGQPAVRIHEVAPGETLSEIASEYLGTHRRYRELFEANRDVLKSPDAIRVGMKLKIPPSGASRSVAPEPRENGTLSGSAPLDTPAVKVPEISAPTSPGSAPDPKSPADPPKPRFVRPTGVVPRISSKPGRSLGQRPPPGVPRVEGLDTVVARRRGPQKAALRDKADATEKKQ